MKVKLFHAETMHEAIRDIKAELGPDAIILSTKRVRQGSLPFGLFGKPLLEVTAATDRDAKEFAPIPQPAIPVPRQVARPVLPTPPAAPEPAPLFQDTLSALLLRSATTQPLAQAAPVPSPVAPPLPPVKSTERVHRVKQDLRELHQRLTTSLPDDAPTEGAGFPAPIARACRQLIDQGLRHASAEHLCLALRRRLASETTLTDGAIQETLHRLLVEAVRGSGPLLSPGDNYNVAMFVGPSGVGKTTAIVKLATHYRLEEHKSVVLITLDTCRTAAVEHLRMYADVLGVTLETAQTTADVMDGIRRHREANLILIDTPGFGVNETARLAHLGGLKDSYGPIETHLVLSACTRMQDLRRTVARYDVCAPTRLLFTKLDETAEYGNLFELAYQTTLPLSYWGIGQQVPEDLELAQPGRLADLLLERGSAHVTSPGLSSPRGCDSLASVGGTTPQHAQ
ncbi:MAG: flagellar biosynthesis protein FlhF [Nitrospirota bacterium]|nr:flagellar biosynthesis protein FlhF [Nitrospirota bacterium]MDP2383748.1 flagellar biosynthesis protein FlhF [Nitrospirota bacterium]MDP3596631.1 flagellar biosynthesis protein FlhF [Nitrospirota bacterium]